MVVITSNQQEVVMVEGKACWIASGPLFNEIQPFFSFNIPRAFHSFTFVCLDGWFLKVLVNYKVISWTGPKTERLTILHAATHETELGDRNFCLSQSHYTDTDPNSTEQAIPLLTM